MHVKEDENVQRKKSVKDAILNNPEISEARKTKKKMDEINYGGLYKEYSEEELFFRDTVNTEDGKDFVELEPKEEKDIDKKSIVNTCYQELDATVHKVNTKAQEKDPNAPKVNIGVISNGVHGLDLINRYFSPEDIKDIKWSDKRVMLVYEAPSNNLNWSYAYKKRNCSDVSKLLNNFDDIKFREKLTRNWWRLDSNPFDLKSNKSAIFESLKGKEYCSLPWFLIKYFGISNLYITNLCRYELFKIGTSNKAGKEEQYLKWQEICKKQEGAENKSYIDIVYDGLFQAEYAAFPPDVILATANPYIYLSGIAEYKDKIIKIIHPANQTISAEHRLVCNTCYIAKELCSKGIIGNEWDEVIKEYLEV